MYTKVITINDELKNYIERLGHEVEGAKELIAFMIDSGRDIKSDTFKEYNDEYIRALTAYNIAKEELSKKYIPEALLEKDASGTKWELKFATSELTITNNGKVLTEDEFNSFFN